MIEQSQQPKTAVYASDTIKTLTGQEPFVNGSVPTSVSISDFWRWAYSDLIKNTQRGVLAEFIVKTALDLGGVRTNLPMRLAFEPYDLLGPELTTPPRIGNIQFARLEVKSSAYLQSWQKRHPDKKQVLSFSIAPATIPDEHGDYKDGAPKQRNSDLYIFCVFTPPAEERGANILDLGLWDFYVAKTKTVDAVCQERKSVALGSEAFAKITGGQKLKFEELCHAVIRACETLE